MRKKTLTYQLFDCENAMKQKTVTATVIANASALSSFEQIISGRFSDRELEFNHAGKIVIFKSRDQH